ncbi:MAG TPA: enediyne antibiotic chromoprotein [Streptosporangiaceae bacterium]|nr:enediyne antibiotic chromoprotein [Streptosporangiaceae bacterium]
MTKVKLAVLVGGTGLVAAGMVLATSGTAIAATPKVTVTPSTGLTSPASVKVAVSGFPARDTLAVAECAGSTSSTIFCYVAGAKSVITSSTGMGKTTLTVHRKFVGENAQGVMKTVNCATVSGGCYVGAADAKGTHAAAKISFA